MRMRLPSARSSPVCDVPLANLLEALVELVWISWIDHRSYRPAPHTLGLSLAARRPPSHIHTQPRLRCPWGHVRMRSTTSSSADLGLARRCRPSLLPPWSATGAGLGGADAGTGTGAAAAVGGGARAAGGGIGWPVIMDIRVPDLGGGSGGGAIGLCMCVCVVCVCVCVRVGSSPPRKARAVCQHTPRRRAALVWAHARFRPLASSLTARDGGAGGGVGRAAARGGLAGGCARACGCICLV
jgi:hypothetical protein